MKTPDARSILIAPAAAPADFLIFAIPARETVLSAVTTTLPDVLSTCQAVPPTSAFCTASLTRESCVALYVCGVAAVAFGRATTVAATSPAAAASIWMRLAMPLRGVVRSILTDLLLGMGGARGVRAREAQPGHAVTCPRQALRWSIGQSGTSHKSADTDRVGRAVSGRLGKARR